MNARPIVSHVEGKYLIRFDTPILYAESYKNIEMIIKEVIAKGLKVEIDLSVVTNINNDFFGSIYREYILSKPRSEVRQAFERMQRDLILIVRKHSPLYERMQSEKKGLLGLFEYRINNDETLLPSAPTEHYSSAAH